VVGAVVSGRTAFPTAFVENVKALITMKDGAELALVQAVAQGIGYCVQPVRDDPLRLGIPHSRRRVCVFFLREDLAAKWGMPALFPQPESRPMIPLEHFLLPADSEEVQEEFRAFDLKLLESGLEASFRPVIWPEDGLREPHCACGRAAEGDWVSGLIPVRFPRSRCTTTRCKARRTESSRRRRRVRRCGGCSNRRQWRSSERTTATLSRQ
jgi:site-specific DNA-cytosine methylase